MEICYIVNKIYLFTCVNLDMGEPVILLQEDNIWYLGEPHSEELGTKSKASNRQFQNNILMSRERQLETA